MALLEVQDRQVDTVLVDADPSGDSFRNDGRTELIVYNPGASPITVTAITQRYCNQGFKDDWPKVVDPGVLMQFGPFPGFRFNTPQGLVEFTYSATDDVQVAAKRQV